VGEDDQSTLVLRSLEGCYIWCESAKIGRPHLHSSHRHSTTDWRIATPTDALLPAMTSL